MAKPAIPAQASRLYKLIEGVGSFMLPRFRRCGRYCRSAYPRLRGYTMRLSRAILLALLASSPAAAQHDMDSMPGMKMPAPKEPQKAKTPKRPRAFLRPAKPYPQTAMPGMTAPEDRSHPKAHAHQGSSGASHDSMPGMDMNAPGAGAKGASPNAMP